MRIDEYASRILLGDCLEEKLLGAPPALDFSPMRTGSWDIEQPGRPLGLGFSSKGTRRAFPTAKQLERPSERGVVLHFFANHELLALEIMALALLRFPDAPLSFRQGLVATMQEEQEHLGLYISRMAELGVQLGDVPVNRFFWDCLKDMTSPLDFVSGMSLTFEQANLDFALHYRRLFAGLEDARTAALLEKVYEDEIGHVKHGVAWFDRWREPELTQWEAYASRLKLPLSPARAKGPFFDHEARRRANLSQEFCEQLEVFAGTKGRPPAAFYYNADCEIELSREAPGYTPQTGTKKVMAELMNCLMFTAKSGDVVLSQKPPTAPYLAKMRELGFDLPEFQELPANEAAWTRLRESRRWEKFCPWGWTPSSLGLAAKLQPSAAPPLRLDAENFWQSPWLPLFRKSALPELRKRLRQELGATNPQLWGPIEADGVLASEMTDVLVTIGQIHSSLGTPAVIKSPYGFAGSGMMRAYPEQNLSEAQLGWVERQLELYGAVLIEPWLKRIADLSVVWSEDSPQLSSFVFFTNAKGQYKGHSLQQVSLALPPGQRAFLFATKDQRVSAYEQLLAVATWVRERLKEQGYSYAAGIDTMIYAWGDSWHLRVLGEINCRMTMGHVARGLRRRVSQGVPSLWQSVSVLDAQSKGWASLKDMASALTSAHPPLLKQGMIDSGIFFTGDPSQSSYVLGMVAVGEAALQACRGIGELGATVRDPS